MGESSGCLQWLFIQILLKFVIWVQSSYCSRLNLISNCTVAKMFDIYDYDSTPGCLRWDSRPLRNCRPGSVCNKMLHIFTVTLQQRLSKQPPKAEGNIEKENLYNVSRMGFCEISCLWNRYYKTAGVCAFEFWMNPLMCAFRLLHWWKKLVEIVFMPAASCIFKIR